MGSTSGAVYTGFIDAYLGALRPAVVCCGAVVCCAVVISAEMSALRGWQLLTFSAVRSRQHRTAPEVLPIGKQPKIRRIGEPQGPPRAPPRGALGGPKIDEKYAK